MNIKAGVRYVVDTNVAINANCGPEAEGDEECQLQCIEALERVMRDGVVVVDEGCTIQDEYWGKLTPRPPAMGDIFFKHVQDYWGTPKVRPVTITPAGMERGFEELPPNEFDPSDRKFLAAAVSAKAEVLVSTDRDWSENKELTDSLGVKVQQLCPWCDRDRREASRHRRRTRS